MDAISVEAMDRLSDVLAGLLPEAADATLEVHPLRIVPTGLGGFVGLSHGPEGEIFGRRLEASARVAVKAATAEALSAAVTAVTQAFLASDRRALRGQGLLRLDLDTLGPRPVATGEGGAEREVQFKVLFEFLKRPTEEGGVIERIPIDLDLGRGVPPRTLARLELGAGSLARFEIVDDKDDQNTTGRPSKWQENAAEGRVEQISSVGSSVKLPENPKKPGTYLVLTASPSRPPARDVLLRATLRSGGAGGLGLVFRWQDVDNFYFFLMHSEPGPDGPNYRVLGKKKDGVFAVLETPALDKTKGFEAGRLYDVKLVAEGPAFEVHLDGERILAGRDAALAAPGRVGLMSRNNQQAFFHRFSAVQL